MASRYGIWRINSKRVTGRRQGTVLQLGVWAGLTLKTSILQNTLITEGSYLAAMKFLVPVKVRSWETLGFPRSSLLLGVC
jgi:hypothetical protein